MDSRKLTDKEIYELFDRVIIAHNIGQPVKDITSDNGLSTSTVNKVIRAMEHAKSGDLDYLSRNRKSLGRVAAWAWIRWGPIADPDDDPEDEPLTDFATGTDLTVIAARINCPVCGYQYAPSADLHYIAQAPTPGGLSAAIGGAPLPLFDAFDCPRCGSQYRAQPRAERSER